MGAIAATNPVRQVTVLPLRTLSDERLAELAGVGHSDAFATLYERYRDSLARYCRSIVRDVEDAHDALQNTMVSVLKALKVRRPSGPIRPWLYRIAHNESISVLRRRHPHEELSQYTPASSDTELASFAKYQIEALFSDLRSLPERQRGALVMRELGGLEYDEIGQALEMTAISARKHVFEARVALNDIAAGRDTDCADIVRRLSDGDGRVARARGVQGHLRDCASCSAFERGMRLRRGTFALIPGLPLVTAGTMLTAVLHGGGHSPAAGHAAPAHPAHAGHSPATHTPATHAPAAHTPLAHAPLAHPPTYPTAVPAHPAVPHFAPAAHTPAAHYFPAAHHIPAAHLAAAPAPASPHLVAAPVAGGSLVSHPVVGGSVAGGTMAGGAVAAAGSLLGGGSFAALKGLVAAGALAVAGAGVIVGTSVNTQPKAPAPVAAVVTTHAARSPRIHHAAVARATEAVKPLKAKLLPPPPPPPATPKIHHVAAGASTPSTQSASTQPTQAAAPTTAGPNTQAPATSVPVSATSPTTTTTTPAGTTTGTTTPTSAPTTPTASGTVAPATSSTSWIGQLVQGALQLAGSNVAAAEAAAAQSLSGAGQAPGTTNPLSAVQSLLGSLLSGGH